MIFFSVRYSVVKYGASKWLSGTAGSGRAARWRSTLQFPRASPFSGFQIKMTTNDSIDGMAGDFATAAVELAQAMGVALDFGEQSLRSVEGILTQLHDEVHGNGGPVRSLDEPRARPSANDMVEMSKLWGCYLGEVVRRRWGGEWSVERYPGGEFATLTLTVGGNKLFPSLKVYRRLTQGVGDDVWEFYTQVRKKLESLPGARVQ